MTAANEFIKKEIKPEIEDIYKQIDDGIDKLIDESKTIQRDSEEEIENSRRNLEELQSQMSLRMTLNSVKIVGSILGIFGPTATVGAAICGVASIAENLVIDNASKNGAITAPSKAIEGVNKPNE